MKLNLGAADRAIPGYLSVDISPPADVIADLSRRWPWLDSSVDEVVAFDVIEHLPDRIHTMNELHRVLKPGGWVTLVFHNTDAAVWSALQRAAGAAGFDIERAANLDRQQQSHKGYKGRAGEEQVAHFDVIVSMRKLGGTTRAANRRAVTREEMRGIVEALRAEWPLARFTVQRVHAEVLRRLAASDGDLGSVEFSTIEALCRASPPPTRGHPAATASARKRKAGIASNAQGSLFRREEWKP